ncbi:hypothetical protein RvY_14941 [Ramazzottius varieornatus]|uniref:Uncharacterized protein n=1 Tax=Ramazzottius varieornatus TaxID=947166 RepID=A0A1D1VUS4_RAMVA|nr:hypothetical protein RvY_14941 [Ramazzottius varieornatus]
MNGQESVCDIDEQLGCKLQDGSFSLTGTELHSCTYTIHRQSPEPNATIFVTSYGHPSTDEYFTNLYETHEIWQTFKKTK